MHAPIRRAALRCLTVTSLLLVSTSSLALARAVTRSAPARPWLSGEVVVALAPGAGLSAAPDGSARAGNTALAATLARFGLARAENLCRASSTATRTASFLRLRSSLADFDARAAAAALRAQPGVLGAAPNLNMRLDLVPNDPDLSNQWHLSNSAAAIHAPAGWNRSTGSPDVVIAIIDTGVDIGHPDLVSKIWTNPGEIPGNGIDDDHNGYQDDVHGWDFGDGASDPSPKPIFDPVFGIDEGWHGTYVAGLAAAATNNGIGIAGVAWGCRVLPLKVANAAGDIPLSAIVSAVDYAIAARVSVINFSLGAADTSARSIFQPLVNAAFNADIVVVASAGNDGTDTPNYPAACDSVLSVAATNVSNVRSSFSNWGWYVNLCAPGETMWSSISRNYVYDDTSQLYFEILWGWDGVNPYMSGDGTSFSAPLVSGAVAVMRSQSPGMHARLAMDRIIATGDVKLYDNPIGPKLDLDAALAFPLAVAPGGTPAQQASFAPPAPNPASRVATLGFSLASAGRARLAIFDAAGRQVRVLAEGTFAGGPRSFAWDLRDANGRPSPAGLYFARLEADGRVQVRRIAVAP
jgi:subtilisin family serine protease